MYQVENKLQALQVYVLKHQAMKSTAVFYSKSPNITV